MVKKELSQIFSKLAAKDPPFSPCRRLLEGVSLMSLKSLGERTRSFIADLRLVTPVASIGVRPRPTSQSPGENGNAARKNQAQFACMHLMTNRCGLAETLLTCGRTIRIPCRRCLARERGGSARGRRNARRVPVHAVTVPVGFDGTEIKDAPVTGYRYFGRDWMLAQQPGAVRRHQIRRRLDPRPIWPVLAADRPARPRSYPPNWTSVPVLR